MSTNIRRRELKSVKAFFIPEGETVDGVTVAIGAWPDDDPTTNYTDFEFEDIESMTDEEITEEETRSLPRDSGGYYQDSIKHFRGRRFTTSTVKTNNLIKQLQNQVAAAVVAGTPQQPGVTATPQLDGVLLLEVKGNDGAIIERIQIWSRMTLQSPGEAKPQNAVLQVRWELIPAANNTYEVPS